MKTHKQYDELVKEKYDDAIIRLIDRNPLLSETQKKTIYLYQDFLESKQKQIYVNKFGRTRYLKPLKSFQSIQTYLSEVINFGEFIKKEYKEATREDIDNYRIYLKKYTSEERAREKEEAKFKFSNIKIKRNPLARKDNTSKTYISQYTIEMYSNLIKRFYIWLYNKDDLLDSKVPELVSHLQKTKEVANTKKIDPNEVLTPEDEREMIEKTENPRDRAFISLLYESAGRIGEILCCNISSFEDKGQYGYIKLVGKTGTRRPVIIHSLPYLRRWINEHIYKDDRDAPLFIGFSHHNKYGRLSKRGASDILKRVGERAGIKKPLNLHHQRHSRLDYLYRTQGLNERDLRYLAGWSENTKMHLRYVHYGEDAVNEKLLKANGIEINKITKRDLAFNKRICSICKERFPDRPDLYEFPAESKYCVTCGTIIDESEAMKVQKLKEDEDNFIDELMEHYTTSPNISQKMKKTLFQSMNDNPLLMEKFKDIFYKNEFDKI